MKKMIKDWEKSMVVRRVAPIYHNEGSYYSANYYNYYNLECELAEEHYLKGYCFPEYKYPLRELYKILCDQFKLPHVPLNFTNRGYRYKGLFRYNSIWGPEEIVLHNKGGRNVATLIHEVAHHYGHGHDWKFKKGQEKILRWVEDNVFPPPKGHVGWRVKLATKYVKTFGDNIDHLEKFAYEHDIDAEELLNLIVEC